VTCGSLFLSGLSGCHNGVAMSRGEITQMRFDTGALAVVGDGAGPVDGPVVLLLHGGGQTRHAWGDTLSTLASLGFRCIALDARGHGDAEWSSEARYRLDAFADDVVAVIHQVGSPAALVGASLGGLTSLIVAGERAPELIWALVLVDVAPRIEDAGRQRILDFMQARPDGFASLEEAADAVAAYANHRPRPTDPRGLKKNLRHGPDGRWRWHWDPRLFTGDFPLRTDDESRFEDAARALRIPTLLVRGARSDVLSAAGMERFHELVPQAVSIEVPDAAHMVAGDNNVRFGNVVGDFLVDLARQGIAPDPAGRS
jgi:pimeloyl-ACP methyl ester carboxylesterase